MKYKVKDYPHLVKDLETKAVINTDQDSYQTYIAERSYREKISKSTNSLEQEINNLKTDIADIKSLLVQLIGNK